MYYQYSISTNCSNLSMTLIVLYWRQYSIGYGRASVTFSLVCTVLSPELSAAWCQVSTEKNPIKKISLWNYVFSIVQNIILCLLSTTIIVRQDWVYSVYILEQPANFDGRNKIPHNSRENKRNLKIYDIKNVTSKKSLLNKISFRISNNSEAPNS